MRSQLLIREFSNGSCVYFHFSFKIFKVVRFGLGLS